MLEFTTVFQQAVLTDTSKLANCYWEIKHTRANCPHEEEHTDMVCKSFQAQLGKMVNLGNQDCAPARTHSKTPI